MDETKSTSVGSILFQGITGTVALTLAFLMYKGVYSPITIDTASSFQVFVGIMGYIIVGYGILHATKSKTDGGIYAVLSILYVLYAIATKDLSGAFKILPIILVFSVVLGTFIEYVYDYFSDFGETLNEMKQEREKIASLLPYARTYIERSLKVSKTTKVSVKKNENKESALGNIRKALASESMEDNRFAHNDEPEVDETEQEALLKSAIETPETPFVEIDDNEQPKLGLGMFEETEDEEKENGLIQYFESLGLEGTGNALVKMGFIETENKYYVIQN